MESSNTQEMIKPFKLANAPIVEAVVDIDCDMPPGFDLATLEKESRDMFRATYPKFRQQFIQEHKIEASVGVPPKFSSQHGIQALQFLHDDAKQLVQIRAQGFSFNRLNPYSTLDDYLGEIERTWNLFRALVKPVQVRVVRLRYINRIDVPLADGKVLLGEFFKISPQMPPQSNLMFAGFLNQHIGVESGTGHQANIVMTSQSPETATLPVILDICVGSAMPESPENWAWILATIQSLRDLKNRIFKNTLTEKCLNLFQR